LGMSDRVVSDPRLEPGFDAEALTDILGEHSESDILMLVGHEPDFSLTVGSLIGGGRVVCKKGGLARVDVVGASSGGGELVWLLPPKDLTRRGKTA
jgi:phosphohistidine phosphatase